MKRWLGIALIAIGVYVLATTALGEYMDPYHTPIIRDTMIRILSACIAICAGAWAYERSRP